MELVK